MFTYLTKSIVRYFNTAVLSSIVVGLTLFSVLIGFYNYDTSMKDLRSKTANTGDLASIGLTEPIWNLDNSGVQDIFTAIFLDVDVIGIQVVKVGGKVLAERKRDAVGKVDFADLVKNPNYIYNVSKLMREGQELAQVQIVTSTERVRGRIQTTTLLIAGFALSFVVLLSGFIWALGVRIVQRPINGLRASADSLADGNLDQEINTERKDELGSLAVSFDKMRNAIRKKLADLAILNNTGEKLAGIHDQAIALETAIKVMSEQTSVERGSIYLLDSSKALVLSAFYPPMAEQASHFPKSFALGEGIVGKVATSGKIEFLPDVSKGASYVSGSPGEKPKALLCVPMMDDKEVFGVMNFVGAVGSVNFSAEDEGFALTIARMVVITIKNIQMLAVIEEQNRTLEERILERTAQLRQKTNDVNNMLQNMRQGIFTIVPGGVIHPEHSAYLGDIFETNEIANVPVFPFLFDHSDLGSDVLSQVSATLDSMIGEDSMMFEFNSHLLVTEYEKFFEGGRSKILELDWNPVLDSNDRIDKLMVTVRDVTELKALQRETEKQKEELDIIGQILAVSSAKLQEFVATSNAFFAENKALIEQHTQTSPEVVATLFRNMHTIKGNARTYGLTYVTDRVHEAESTYDRLRSQSDAVWDQQHLLAELEVARVCVERYHTVFTDKLAGFSGDADSGGGIDKSVLESIAQAVDGVDEMSQLAALQQSLLAIKSSISMARSEPVAIVLKGIVEGLPSVASQLDKETPRVTIDDHGIRLTQGVSPMVRNVFMHVFRNSLDHGLESTAQRVAAGKPEQGSIRLDVALNEDSVVFEFQDDGRGLALESIHKKAVQTGQVAADRAMTDDQIADLIFLSGLSTAESLTSVSGRGVGMDAIKQFLHKSGGDIQLVFTSDAVGGFRPFKQVITLPAKHAVKAV